MNDRSFKLQPAVRERVPLLVGLAGPSGWGKTYTALELATGMQEVVGGDIIVIDTENRRALHYAENFKFQHLDFGAPFGSLDYLSALRFAADQNPAAIVIDSMSHEHEGPGGLIDMHAKEVERMAGNDYAKQQRVQMLAWQKPKAARRALLNGLVSLNQNVIMCFRAGEKSKPGKDDSGKSAVIEQGFTPIAAPEFVYEMTVCALLRPNEIGKGVPTWQSDKPGEYSAIKMPGQFQGMFKSGQPINRAHGRALAEWARGSATASARPESLDIDAMRVEGAHAASLGSQQLRRFWSRLSGKAQAMLTEDKDKFWKPAAEQADKDLAIVNMP